MEPEIPAKYKGQLVLKNPNGTLSQAIPTDNKSERTSVISSHVSIEANQADDLVENWLKHRNFFIVFLTVELLLEAMFSVFEVIYSGSAISDLHDVYGTDAPEITYLYWSLFIANIVYAVVYYTFGYYSIWSRQVKTLQYFSYYALIGILGQVFLAYLHKFNLLVFFIRLLIYVYARYIIGMLTNILLLPSWDG
jgi:hypothetical protein